MTPLERCLAAYAVSTINGCALIVPELESRLAALGAPRCLIANIERAAGRWSVSDDDRIDAIAGYAARLTRSPADLGAGDLRQLRAVGLDDADIFALNQVVASYNYVTRVAIRPIVKGGAIRRAAPC